MTEAEFLPSIWRQQAVVDDLMEGEKCPQSSDPEHGIAGKPKREGCIL